MASNSAKTDPNSTPSLFDCDVAPEDARVHLIAVPWEVTTSYGGGTSHGPEAIRRASHQVDLFDLEVGDAWKAGYVMPATSQEWLKRGHDLKSRKASIDEVNLASRELNDWVDRQATQALSLGKIAGVVGGDHSSPFGLIRAIDRHTQGDFGVLHIDAHADLRDAYQGYEHSHASIMRNVVEKIRPRVLVQIGIRDFCREEYDFSESRRALKGDLRSGRIVTHYDRATKKRLFEGESFHAIARSWIQDLPQNVYVSFDIDGLDPALCPSTGTPVPGGLSFDQALSIFSLLAESGKRIVGFDLNEVSEPLPGQSEWDANVGARLLFKLCGWAVITNGNTNGK